MAITQGVCNSFKLEVMNAVHDLDTDDLRIALYTEESGLGPTVTEYTSTGESTGSGYTAGGQPLTGAVVSLDGSVAIVDFNDVVWPNATISAAGALIYNASKGNRAIAVLSFNGTKESTEGDFSVIMPVPDAANAVIQLA